MLAERAAASLSRIATWGPTSEEPALPDATAGGTELPAVPVVAAVPAVAGADALPAAVVDAAPVVAAALVPVAGAAVALPAVADAELAVVP